MSSALNVTTNNFKSEVIESDKPVLVDFWASWCMPCKMLGPIVDKVADQFAGSVKVVKVNVDEDQSLAAEYGIRGIPALLIFRNGQIVDRMVGLQQQAAIEKKLNSVLEE